MKRFLALALGGLLLLPGLGALELKAGLVKVVIDDATARLTLYKLIDIAKGRYEPLLFDVDPRTSYGTISFGGKMSKLGDSADYKVSVQKTDTGGRITFKSAQCVVDEDIAFASSVGAALPDGIRVTFTITNVSQKDSEVGLRLILDTWLGEKSGVHFRTEGKAKVAGETLLEASSPEQWVSSPGERAEFMVVLQGAGVTRPDKALLANWKRINDEPWIPEVASGRSFTLLPYSVNDSALALYWQPQAIPKGEKRSVVLVMGSFNEAGYQSDKAGADGTTALFDKTVLAAASGNPADAMALDLVSVRDLISQIDQAVASGRPLSAEQIAAWRKILDILEDHKKAY